MAFEEVELLSSYVPIDAVPRDGVRVSNRATPGKGAVRKRFITVGIGRGLAAKLKLIGEESRVRMLFGTGEDAGKIAITVDQAGKFKVRKLVNETWSFTINAQTADGLFSTDFAPFCVLEPEVISLPGKAPFAQFTASPEMLAAD